MISHRTLRIFAKVLLGALLFAQAALVFAACESAWRSPARAIALVERGIDGDCHEQSINVNLCLAHCLGEDQSLDKPITKVPALSAATVFFMPAAAVSPHEVRAPQRWAVPHTVGPPLRILFQSFLI